jgi:hypothetical protein
MPSSAARSSIRGRPAGPRGRGRAGSNGSMSFQSRSSIKRCLRGVTTQKDHRLGPQDHAPTHRVLRPGLSVHRRSSELLPWGPSQTCRIMASRISSRAERFEPAAAFPTPRCQLSIHTEFPMTVATIYSVRELSSGRSLLGGLAPPGAQDAIRRCRVGVMISGETTGCWRRSNGVSLRRIRALPAGSTRPVPGWHSTGGPHSGGSILHRR